jgi:hypothetical protein
MSGKKIAVVGGGLTGAVTALLLHRLRPDIQVTVWEKSLNAGRLFTKRKSDRAVDMGAQYITQKEGANKRLPLSTGNFLYVGAVTKVLAKLINCQCVNQEYYNLLLNGIYRYYSELLQRGILVPFPGIIEGEKHFEGSTNYVAVEGMDAIVKYCLTTSGENR